MDTLTTPRQLFLLLALLFAGTSAQAEVYKWVDAEGNTHYSDEAPSDDAKPVELRPLPTMPFEKLQVPKRSSTGPKQQDAAGGYQGLTITSPAHETTIRDVDAPIPVAVRLEPPLAAGHQLQLRMDGEVIDQGSGGLSVQTRERGAHQLLVEVVDESGEPVISSAPVTIFVHRPSVQNPNHPVNRQPKPTP